MHPANKVMSRIVKQVYCSRAGIAPTFLSIRRNTARKNHEEVKAKVNSGHS